MSPTPAVRAARTLIARSDHLFFDTRNLRYVTGLARPEGLTAAVIKELLDGDELQVINASAYGVVAMELTEEAFRRGVANRRRGKGANHRVDTVQFLAGTVSGTRSDDDLLDGKAVKTLVAIPFTSNLFGKLLAATSEALEAFKADPRRVGATARTPGHLVPVKISLLRDNPLDVMSFFEAADLSVMINAANGQYSFGAAAHGFWIGTENQPISEFVTDTLKQLGKRASNSVAKQAEKLLKDPLVKERTIHPDEESRKIMDAIKNADDNNEQEAA